MEIVKTSKAVAVVTTALFVASTVWLLNTKRINSSLETGLKEQRLKSESLLSEKLLLEKDIEKFKEQLSALKDQNTELDNLFNTTTAKLNAQEADYNRLKKENATLGQIRKQRQELLAIQDQLKNELQALKTSYAALESENKNLNQTIAALEERNKILVADLNRAMYNTVDQSQLHAIKSKPEKLTVKAKRTKRLIANFEVPAHLKNLSFRVINDKGNLLGPKEGSISFNAVPSDNSYLASNENTESGKKLQKVEMTYTPLKKLTPGVYTVEILNENLHVGSLKVKLK